MRTPLDHLRAVLIVAHVVAITLAAIPAPNGELSPARRRDPEVQAALDPWAKVVVRLGLAEDRDAGVDWLFDAGATLTATRRRVIWPFKDYLRFTGNGQSWRMFGVSPPRHGRLEIHGHVSGGEWEPLYVEQQGPSWGWLVIDHSRVRALRSSFATQDSRGRYQTFARWLARKALEEDPRFDEVRVRYVGLRTPPPAQLRANGMTETRVHWPITVRRGAP